MLKKTVILAAATLAAAVIIDYQVQPTLAQYAAQSNQVRDDGAQSSDRGREQQREEQSCSRLDRYDEGYRTGYSAGYEAARNTQRYDERPEVIAENRGSPGTR
jgi:flagellar biosynthesis/type III secretory pathway protein FliH